MYKKNGEKMDTKCNNIRGNRHGKEGDNTMFTCQISITEKMEFFHE